MRHKKSKKVSSEKSHRSGSNSNHRSKTRPKKFTNKISDHFSKKDFACKESGQFKISLGLVGILEELRSKIQKRIEIVKGFESLEVAEKRGKLKRNFHTMGLAADIRVDGMSPQELFTCVESIEGIAGIGLNVADNYVHIDTRKAERLCWVEEKNEEIELTPENKSTYFG